MTSLLVTNHGVHAPTTTQQTLERLIADKGAQILSDATPADGDKFSAKLSGAIEKFAKNTDSSWVIETARQLNVNGQTVVVVTDTDYAKNKENVAFFSEGGARLATTAVNWNNDGLWLQGQPPPIKEHVSGALVEELKRALDNEEDEREIGVDIEPGKLPPLVRQRFDWVQRNASDGDNSQVIELASGTLYCLSLYSSVNTYLYVTDKGTIVHESE